MATSLVDYCEQTNPKVLEELNRERPNMPNARRVHESFLAQPEKRFMIWIAERLPRWVNSDHLTVLGFLAQIMAGLSYARARQSSPKCPFRAGRGWPPDNPRSGRTGS